MFSILKNFLVIHANLTKLEVSLPNQSVQKALDFEYHATKVGYNPNTNIYFSCLQPKSNFPFFDYFVTAHAIITKIMGLVFFLVSSFWFHIFFTMFVAVWLQKTTELLSQSNKGPKTYLCPHPGLSPLDQPGLSPWLVSLSSLHFY